MWKRLKLPHSKVSSSLEMITFEKGSKLESISGVRDLGAFDGAINLTTVDMSECTQVKRIDEYTFMAIPTFDYSK